MEKENICVALLNNVTHVDEAAKQLFIAELKKLHADGFYIVGIKGSSKFKVSNKNPDTLQKQIDCFDELVEKTFELTN